MVDTHEVSSRLFWQNLGTNQTDHWISYFKKWDDPLLRVSLFQQYLVYNETNQAGSVFLKSSSYIVIFLTWQEEKTTKDMTK